MATSSYMINSSKFFTMSSPSSRNSTKKSKSCLQLQAVVNQNSNNDTNGKTARLNVDSDTKIKLDIHQPLHNGRSRLTSSSVDGFKVDDVDDMTSPPETMGHLILGGRLIKGGLVFQENICIRSFEVDPDYKLSTKAIMHYLQDSSLKKTAMSCNAFWGVTPEMIKRDLVSVLRSIHIEVDRYPYWNDVVQLSLWQYTSGRTSMRFDWIITDLKTGETLVRASCLAVMMNTKTRKTCKFPEEVKREVKPFLREDAEPIVQMDKNVSLQVDTMDHIRTGLTPGWYDLDKNYHVNNCKYIDWILESIPGSLLYSHELCTISLEFRKECLKDDVVQSSSKIVSNGSSDDEAAARVEVRHVVRLESGPQVLRAKTIWRPKSVRVPT